MPNWPLLGSGRKPRAPSVPPALSRYLHSHSPAGPGDAGGVQNHHHLTHPSGAQICFALRKKIRSVRKNSADKIEHLPTYKYLKTDPILLLPLPSSGYTTLNPTATLRHRKSTLYPHTFPGPRSDERSRSARVVFLPHVWRHRHRGAARRAAQQTLPVNPAAGRPVSQPLTFVALALGSPARRQQRGKARGERRGRAGSGDRARPQPNVPGPREGKGGGGLRAWLAPLDPEPRPGVAG